MPAWNVFYRNPFLFAFCLIETELKCPAHILMALGAHMHSSFVVFSLPTKLSTCKEQFLGSRIRTKTLSGVAISSVKYGVCSCDNREGKTECRVLSWSFFQNRRYTDFENKQLERRPQGKERSRKICICWNNSLLNTTEESVTGATENSRMGFSKQAKLQQFLWRKTTPITFIIDTHCTNAWQKTVSAKSL